VLTYLARRPITDQTGFTHDATEKRYIGRLIKNDMEIVKALRSCFENDAPPPGYGGAVVRFVDMQDLNFKEQVEVAITTDVFLSPHGAGLVHSALMRDSGVLVELRVQGAHTDRLGGIFKSIAMSSDHTYIGAVVRGCTKDSDGDPADLRVPALDPAKGKHEATIIPVEHVVMLAEMAVERVVQNDRAYGHVVFNSTA